MLALVVDDDDFSAEIVRNVLSQMGYETATARNGAEALQLFAQNCPPLVITDWEMPQMNGLELCRAIRADSGHGYTYIIMVTGQESAEQKLEGLKAGADSFITKPLNVAELAVCLKKADRILSLETRDLAIFALAKLAESRD